MKQLITLGCLLAAAQSFAQTGNVGIGTINPKAQLHTTGTVRFDTLRGTGTRPVYVTDSGNLVTGNPPAATSSSTPYAIPDASCTGVSSPITITSMATAVPSSNIQVKINISHTFDDDLIIYLISPSGQILNLAFQNGGGGDNYINTVFSDGATAQLSAASPPFTGTYRPVGSTAAVGTIYGGSGGTCAYAGTVASFGGFGATVVPNGTWTLKVIDYDGGDVGTINNWSISFNGSIAPPVVTPNYVVKANADGFLTSSSIYDNGNVGLGTTTPHATLQFGNGLTNRKIVLYESGNDDNQFYGFGVNGSTLRYQTDVPSSDHVFYAGAGATASNELMRIKGTGNVGIGTAAPAQKLDVAGTMDAGRIAIGNTTPIADLDIVGDTIGIRNGSAWDNLWFTVDGATANINASGAENGLKFKVGSNSTGAYGNGQTLTTAMTIMPGGNVGVGTTSPLAKMDVQGTFSVGEIAYPAGLAFSMRQDAPNFVGRIANYSNSGSGSSGLRIDACVNTVPSGGFGGYVPAFINFYRPDGTMVGGVTQINSASVGYYTTSDMRLKRDINLSHYSLADLLKIQVRDYRYIGDESLQTGFLAQQLYTIFPNAVSKGGDDQKTHPWMVDYGRLTPLIIKAMQDMNEKVEALEKENTALKAQAAQIDKLAQQVAELQTILSTLTKVPGVKAP